MSLPRAIANPAAIMALLIATVAPKLWLQQRSTDVDERHLSRDIAATFRARGFAIEVEHFAPGPAIAATQGPCRLLIRNGDRARELGTLFEMEGANVGPVSIGYRGVWKPGPAAARAIVERFAQNNAARLGFFFARPAVLAVAQSSRCPDMRHLLDPISAHSARTT